MTTRAPSTSAISLPTACASCRLALALSLASWAAGSAAGFSVRRSVTAKQVAQIRGLRHGLRFRAEDAGANQLDGLRRLSPAQHLHPFALLEILVVREKMAELLDQHLGQVAIATDPLVVGMQPVDRHDDDLLVDALLVLHKQRADGTRADHRAGRDGGRRNHHAVERIAVL